MIQSQKEDLAGGEKKDMTSPEVPSMPKNGNELGRGTRLGKQKYAGRKKSRAAS